MHNGQVGAFQQFRKAADMSIPDELYSHRKGATDSEVIFLKALEYGLDEDPIRAMTRAVLEMEQLSKRLGTTPHMRFSDRKRLFAMRYASDAFVRSLYYRWSTERLGYTVVSEPLGQEESGCIQLPAGSICEITDGTLTQHEIVPLMAVA